MYVKLELAYFFIGRSILGYSKDVVKRKIEDNSK
jgi:hypothetical protein